MKFTISTKGLADIIDITSRVTEAVKKSNVREGICLISCPGSTAGITTIEYEPELLKDFKEFLEKIIPSDTRALAKGGDEALASSTKEYHHDKVWGEKNGFSHIRSSLIRPFLTVPIEDGKLVLGQWQQIVVIDFDNRPREREIIVKVIKQ